MNAQDIMTREVATVRPDADLAAAITIMLDRHVSGLPVVDEHAMLVGILTEGDLLRRGETGTEQEHGWWLDLILGPGRTSQEYVRSHSRLVGDVMTREPVTVEAEAPLVDIVELMERRHIKRVPVLCSGALCGIVSRSDLLRALRRSLEQAVAQPVGDADIYQRISAELDRRDWAPQEGFTLEVVDGVVALEGVVFDERIRAAIRVLVQNTAGVKGIRDELTLVDPATGMALGY